MTSRQTQCRIKVIYGFLLIILIALVGSVNLQAASPAKVIEQVPAERLPVFADDLQLDRLAAAIQASLKYWDKLPESREFNFGEDRYRAGQLKAGLAEFLAFIETKPSQNVLSQWISRHCRVYAVTENGAPGGVLFTGYYIPVLNGSRNKTRRYRYPVYNRPSDLVTFRPADFCTDCSHASVVGRYAGREVVPYYTRTTIESSNVLADTAAPIVWVDDPVDLFFLHVQGSGLVELPTGELINIHYAITNGYPYKSIGRHLIHTGKIARKDLTMQSIRSYLENHPGEQDAIFAYNPRYVFFTEEPGGATGCLGVEITPGRTIAMDQDVYPSGSLAFIQSEKPVLDQSGEVKNWVQFSRFALNQDTGDAIRGLGRVDIFWGGGQYAEAAAGRMKHAGALFILMPK